MSGTLYVIATPIGNLEDLSPRALRLLGEVAAIACEDTRQSRKLLEHFEIHKPLLSFHDFNERERTASLVNRLRQGESLALVSDAGTPLIADPGYRLVEAAIEAGLAVVPVPGPCALVAALSASGLPTDSFYFGGFLPSRSGQRRKQIGAVSHLDTTLVFYETPHRIVECLADLAALCPNRPVVLARELTKLHEEFLRGSAAELAQILGARPAIKGEFTVILGKAARPEQASPSSLSPLAEAVKEKQTAGLARMDAIKAVARERGLPKREVYRQLEERES